MCLSLPLPDMPARWFQATLVLHVSGRERYEQRAMRTESDAARARAIK
jgi:hypothetical protein